MEFKEDTQLKPVANYRPKEDNSVFGRRLE